MYKIVLFVCAQALLIQSSFSQYIPVAPTAYNIGASSCDCNDHYGNGINNSALLSNSGVNGAAATASVVGYGGEGTGELVAIGELPVTGVTSLEGHLPVYGLVQFAGSVPAYGLVSVVGNTPPLCPCVCAKI